MDIVGESDQPDFLTVGADILEQPDTPFIPRAFALTELCYLTGTLIGLLFVVDGSSGTE